MERLDLKGNIEKLVKPRKTYEVISNSKCFKKDYFCHKAHKNQNEKLKMFGAAHVMARDGYSGMIVVFSRIPVENNLFIYDEIYSHFKVTYGGSNTCKCQPRI